MDTNIPPTCNILLNYNFEINSPFIRDTIYSTIVIDKNKLSGVQGCIINQTNSIDLQYPDDENHIGYKVIYSLIEIGLTPILSVFIPYEALGIFKEIIPTLSLPKDTNNYIFNYDSDIFKCFKQLLYSNKSNIRMYTDYDGNEYIKDNYVLVFIFTGNTRFLDDTDEIHKNSVFVKLVPKQNEYNAKKLRKRTIAKYTAGNKITKRKKIKNIKNIKKCKKVNRTKNKNYKKIKTIKR